MESEETSKDEMAELVVGMRVPVKGIMLFQPCEEGYHCPVCKYENVIDGNFDERLEWGEYNGFLWCSVCDRDYPSAICKVDPIAAIETYLLCVWEARRRMSYDKHLILVKIGKFVEDKETEKADELSKALTILEKYYKLYDEE